MRAWVQGRQRLLQSVETLRTLRQRVDLVEERLEVHCRALREALLPLSRGDLLKGLGFGALLAKGLSLLEQFDAWQSRRLILDRSLSDHRAQLSGVSAEAGDVAGELRDWKKRWHDAIRGLADPDAADPSVAGRLLERSRELLDRLDAAAGLQKRIEGITKDAEAFISDVREMTVRIGPDLSGFSAEEAVSSLHSRLAKARADSSARDQIGQRIREKEEDLRSAHESIRTMEARLAGLQEESGCGNLDQIEEAERRSAGAQALDADIELLNRQLAVHAGGLSVEDFVTEAEMSDADRLPLLIGEHLKRIDEGEKRLSLVDQTIGSEQRVIEGMDGSARAAEATEAAQTALAEIRDAAERYIILRMASVVLRGGIERNRAATQGPVLTRAGRLFSTLTGGSFENLKRDFDGGDTPVLVGVRPNGDEVGVGGMSEGTCDQLYLALRLGSLERYLSQNDPVPFVIDDILINFDDRRAVAALRILAELSMKTQVIFFTHHRHLAELAQETVPSEILCVHSMGASL
jgi:uncharacterized protein YhaN